MVEHFRNLYADGSLGPAWEGRDAAKWATGGRLAPKRRVALIRVRPKDSQPKRIRLEECTSDILIALRGRAVRIWSAEHCAYWRAPANGYTTDPSRAGIYELGGAWRQTSHCGPEKGIEFEMIA